MAYESVKVSAPGKLMILGEHAVLYGKRCIVCAINRRISLILRLRIDRKLSIHSELGEFESEIDHLAIQPQFKFISSAVKQFSGELKHGLDITVESEFTDKMGLGSSAAVTVATVTALSVLLGKKDDPRQIHKECLAVVTSVQGKGSGADLAASIVGGILCYRTDPLEIDQLGSAMPIEVVYSGNKSLTTEVIEKVTHVRRRFPDLIDAIFDTMDKSCAEAKEAIKAEDWNHLGEILNMNQGLMAALGVSNKQLSSINYDIQRQKGIYGSKISGSGLGDCVIAIGKRTESLHSGTALPLEIDHQGVIIH